MPHSVARGRWGRPSPGIRHMILTVRGATRISTAGAVAGSVRSKWCPRVESLFWTMITKLEFVFGTACRVLFASFLGEFLQLLLLGDTQWLSCCLSEGNKAELVSCPQSWLNNALEESGGETGEEVNWIVSLILSGYWVGSLHFDESDGQPHSGVKEFSFYEFCLTLSWVLRYTLYIILY